MKKADDETDISKPTLETKRQITEREFRRLAAREKLKTSLLHAAKLARQQRTMREKE
jgi:hypothetical protein